MHAPDRRAARANALVIAGLVLFTFAQRPGRITFDTKFDLTADPGTFLARTMHLWNPQLSFGEIQNQAYGYLFPQGPFFWLGDVVGLPDWVVQRLWSALILVLAYAGARRLWLALAPQTRPLLGVLAGLAYALSPRLLGLSGVLTAEVLPTAVLPWVVLPLVLALRGRISPRLGGLLSGAAVLMMGGVNAVENLAALPLPALLILGALGTSLGRRLGGWWVLGTSLACAWWMLALLVLGKYSPPFLDYIETASATTRPLGWTNAVRGADHWLGFITVGGLPWWPGAFALATSWGLIALTGCVAAVSLAGLFHRSMPARAPLAISALLGLSLLTLAHVSSVGSPLSAPVRELLDTSLAMLRNVHKVDPLVRLPLALGFAHAVGRLSESAATVRVREQRTRLAKALPLLPKLVIGVLAVTLLASAQPLFAGDLRKPGWKQIPQAWHQAADYLADHSAGTRALVLPGSGFGQQTWGWTIDEPIQGVSSSPWVTRSQVPLVPGPTIRFLDSLEERIQDGRGSPALADVLARSGVGMVVVRRDLDLLASGAPSPARVDQAIDRSPGLTKVASFGSTGFGDQASIDIYQVNRDVVRVEAVNAADVAAVAGGSEDVISLLEAGFLGAAVPTVIGTSGDPAYVGDGYRRRERSFGRLQDSLSQVMSASEAYRNKRRAHDYPGVAGMARVRAIYPVISGLSASSSSGYADTLGAVRPELGPYSAVDGLPNTYWRSAPLEKPKGQWLELRLKQPQPLGHIDLTMGVDKFSGVPVRRVRVDASGQVSEHVVDPVTGAVRVELSGAGVSRVRVTVTATQGDPASGVVAVREITLPGVELGRVLGVPDDGAGGSSDFVFRAQPHRNACVATLIGPACRAEEQRPSEEESGLFRQFDTSTDGTWTVSGQVVARATPSAAELLWPIDGRVRVEASSVLTDDPAVSGPFAMDGNQATPWLSARGDQNPRLTLTWDKPRVLTRLRVRAAQTDSRTPVEAILQAGAEQRRVFLGPNATGLFTPLRTDRVTISFPTSPNEGDDGLPTGVGDLVIDGLTNLTHRPDLNTDTGAECGFGPPLTVDGQLVQTRVEGTLADVVGGGLMRLVGCGDPVKLTAGTHTLSLASTDRFAPTLLGLDAGTDHPEPVVRATTIRSWESNHRRVRIAPGDAAVLRVPENVNLGWQATLDGKVLKTTVVDGWQQAYLVPAGKGGVVHLDYRPDTPYRWALVLGALLAGLLLAGAAAAWRRERRRSPEEVGFPASFTEPLRLGRIGLVVFALVAWLSGGLSVLVGAVAGVLLRRRAGRVVLGAVLIGGGALVAALLNRFGDGPRWGVLDAITGGAVGLLLATLVEPLTRKDTAS